MIVQPYFHPEEGEEWNEFEDEAVLEQGHAEEIKGNHVLFKVYRCPKCNRVLFEADVELDATIRIWCKRCKRHREILTMPLMKRIGFR